VSDIKCLLSLSVSVVFDSYCFLAQRKDRGLWMHFTGRQSLQYTSSLKHTSVVQPIKVKTIVMCKKHYSFPVIV